MKVLKVEHCEHGKARQFSVDMDPGDTLADLPTMEYCEQCDGAKPAPGVVP